MRNVLKFLYAVKVKKQQHVPFVARNIPFVRYVVMRLHYGNDVGLI